MVFSMLSRRDLESIDQGVAQAVAEGHVPGAVLCIGSARRVLWHESFGARSIQPKRLPMGDATLFDLASLTKPVACATSIMLLAERGHLSVCDSVAQYIPLFAMHGKSSVTIEHLLLHTSGLPAVNPLQEYEQGRTAAIEAILRSELVGMPGKQFLYSDLGYIILGELVHVVAGKCLARFAADELFAPLKMNNTLFNLPSKKRMACAATLSREERWSAGQVHDPRAHALGGVAGHAGLFSTAEDLSKFCRMILRGGKYGSRRVLADHTVAAMSTPHVLPGAAGLRTYAFDCDTHFSSGWTEVFAAGTTFGHTGFTGTMMWLMPRHDCFLVLLTNALHGGREGSIASMRRSVISALGSALQAIM